MRRLRLTLFISLAIALIFIPNGKPAESQNDFFNMSYIFFGSPSSYVSQVDKAKGSLDVVSPNYFDLTAEGDLTVTWKLQSSFINEMHSRGIRVVPFLANHWDTTAGINALKNRDALAKKIADAVKQYNLDGVDVDIEGIGSSYKDAHTDFIRLLRLYLPPDKEVSVATAANPNGWKTGWQGFYDYNALAKYVDYLMIMAYDETWESVDSPIGPVSSIQFFERSIQFAINQGVPRDKIVVGLPFYGRMWKVDGNPKTAAGKTIAGMGLSSTSVKPLVEKFNGRISFDDVRKSGKAEFTIPNGQFGYVGSTELSAGDYVIWYDNESGIKAKLRMPSKYAIKGTGSWALYHETPDTWDYYSLWLNSIYFGDVAADFWAEESIKRVSELGWMTGTGSIEFSPMKNLTRAEGAVTIVRALGKEDAVPSSYQFKDTAGHWAQKEIEIARELGVVSGKSATTFDPNGPLTREELAMIFQNIFGYPVDLSAESSFPDVQKSKWSYEAILALSQQGIITGFPDGTFRPRETSSRSVLAALMDRMKESFEQL